MTAVWPASLPQRPIVDDYSEGPGKNKIHTPMDAGPAKQRRRFTAAVKPLRCSFIMTATQLADFETFYDDTIEGGALPFEITHPRTEATVTARFTDEDPSWVPFGMQWRVTCSLEILP